MPRRAIRCALSGALAGLLLLGACAAPPQRADPQQCLALFERLDWIERFYPASSQRVASDRIVQNAQLSRQVRLIRQADCTTNVVDLAPMDAMAGEGAGFRIADGGGPAVSTALQVGIVDGLSAEIRAATFFGGLGFRYRSTGIEGLGRRVYIGPIRSQAAMDQAVYIARRAGFIAPYPAKWVKF